jgi:bacillithiol synthase
MTAHQLSFEETQQFSTLFLDYINRSEQTRAFYGQFPDIEGFAAQLKLKTLSDKHREVLVAQLRKQYAGIANPPDFEVLLSQKTFTVTTGHQLNIFTGPLYVVYKILTVINLAKKLKAKFPDYHFVPVYWMATEDHDFAEINHFSLFGKTYEWQTTQKGAVGRMTTEGLADVLAQMSEKPAVFEQAYTQSATLADAVRVYMHEIFGQEGLISLDADDRELKRLFAPVLKNELLGRSTAVAVDEASEKLETLGYKTQITPRNINLFYLAEGLRERLVFEDGNYRVLNTDLRFSSRELFDLLENAPEHFSPNVVLRPVYQEVILPNLAYVGGPAEMPYWLQLKGVFDLLNVTFPILMPRNFALVLNKASVKRREKLGLNPNELFDDEVTLRKNFVARNSENSLSLATENEEINSVFEKVLAKALAIDKTLEAAVKGEQQKLANGLENLEKRLKKAEERNQETEITQLLALKQKLFPGGTAQERAENFLNFYLNNPEFLKEMADVFDPLAFKMYVVEE